LTWAKVCGLRDGEELQTVLDCHPDAVGFVVEVPVDSPRRIDRMQAAELIERVPDDVETVAVVMPGDFGEAIELLKFTGASTAQVHSEMAPDELKGLRKDSGCRLICALQAGPAGDVLRRIGGLAGVADAVLLDTPTDSGGGTGMAHDWEESAAVVRRSPLPVILAGGLGPENVTRALHAVGPWGVDASSRLEDNGRKSRIMVGRFLKEVRAYDAVHG